MLEDILYTSLNGKSCNTTPWVLQENSLSLHYFKHVILFTNWRIWRAVPLDDDFSHLLGSSFFGNLPVVVWKRDSALLAENIMDLLEIKFQEQTETRGRRWSYRTNEQRNSLNRRLPSNRVIQGDEHHSTPLLYPLQVHHHVSTLSGKDPAKSDHWLVLQPSIQTVETLEMNIAMLLRIVSLPPAAKSEMGMRRNFKTANFNSWTQFCQPKQELLELRVVTKWKSSSMRRCVVKQVLVVLTQEMEIVQSFIPKSSMLESLSNSQQQTLSQSEPPWE